MYKIVRCEEDIETLRTEICNTNLWTSAVKVVIISWQRMERMEG